MIQKHHLELHKLIFSVLQSLLRLLRILRKSNLNNTLLLFLARVQEDLQW